MFMDGLIVSSFKNVICQNGGSHGIFVEQSRGGAFTSLNFDNCFMLANAARGYYLNQATYCSFNACAADKNGTDAYYLNNCQGVTLNGCGVEYADNGVSQPNTANGFVFDGASSCCTLNACWVYRAQPSGKAFLVTGSSVFIDMIGCRPNTNYSGAQSFQIDSGSSATFIGCSAGGGLLTLNGTYSMMGTDFGGQEQVIGLPKTTAPSTVGTTTGQLYCDTNGTLKFLSSSGNTSLLASVNGNAPVLTPSFANGTASQLSDTTRDYLVYLQIGTAGTAFTLAIGPTSTPANTIMASATPLSDELLSFRLPAGWYVKWAGTSTTLTTQTAIGC